MATYSKDLIYCCAKGDMFALRVVLADGLLQNLHWTDVTTKGGDTAVHTAARNGHLNVLRCLFEQREDYRKVNFANKLGKSALHEAAQNCHVGVVNYLLQHEADVNTLKNGDWTALMLASSKCLPFALATVKALVQHNAEPRMRNKDGWTALHVASKYGNVRIVKFFLNKWPFLASICSISGRYPLHTAALNGHIRIVRRLLANFDEVSPGDQCGVTPLIDACRGNHCDIVTLLLGCGASLLDCDQMGLSCMHVAAETGSINVVKLLIVQHNISVNLKDTVTGLTPLHCAARAGQLETCKMLMAAGANKSLVDSFGRRAHDLIHERPNTEEILLLLE